MAIIFEEEIRNSTVTDIAKRLMVAARTAPKAKGVDNLSIAMADKAEIIIIANKMKDMVDKGEAPMFFLRDAENILQSGALLLIGTRFKACGLPNCGMCGFDDCAQNLKNGNSPCALNTTDLGIAIGSAVSVAADARADNRVMYSVGRAVKELGLMGEEVKIIYGIPLSVSGKSPFFDRKQI